MTTVNTSSATDPFIAGLLEPNAQRDWNLAKLMVQYPWIHASALESTLADLGNATISADQNGRMLDEISAIRDFYDVSISAMKAQRDNLIVDAVLKHTGLTQVELPGPDDIFMVDDRSIANGVLRQHWATALWEWMESEPEPAENGVATCTMTPDEYCEIPFMIEMSSMPATDNSDYLVIHLTAFFTSSDSTVQHAGDAIWMRHTTKSADDSD